MNANDRHSEEELRLLRLYRAAIDLLERPRAGKWRSAVLERNSANKNLSTVSLWGRDG